jgi:hypothetical protein
MERTCHFRYRYDSHPMANIVFFSVMPTKNVHTLILLILIHSIVLFYTRYVLSGIILILLFDDILIMYCQSWIVKHSSFSSELSQIGIFHHQHQHYPFWFLAIQKNIPRMLVMMTKPPSKSQFLAKYILLVYPYFSFSF